MLAMLLAMTSRLVCWAFMPVAAISSALTSLSSDRHAADVEIGGDDLVADGDRGGEGLLRVHHRVDNLARVGLALQGVDRYRLRVLEAADRVAGGVGQRAFETLRDTAGGARRTGSCAGLAERAAADAADEAQGVDHGQLRIRSMVMEIRSRACLMTCRLAS